MMKNLIKMPLWLIAFVLALASCSSEGEPEPEEIDPCNPETVSPDSLFYYNRSFLRLNYDEKIFDLPVYSKDSIKIYSLNFPARGPILIRKGPNNIWSIDISFNFEKALYYAIQLRQGDADTLAIHSELEMTEDCKPLVKRQIYLNNTLVEEVNTFFTLPEITITR